MTHLTILSLGLGLCVGLGLVATTETAEAFCRTRTCEFLPAQNCELDADGCSTVGELVSWGSSCIPFAIQSEGSALQGISASTVGTMVGDGFQVWTEADCGDATTPNLTGFDRGNTACDQAEFNCEAQVENDNIVLFRDGPSNLPSQTIALSTVIARISTGEILDVDIELNSYRYQFDGGEEGFELATVINHELGHLLGLSHTDTAGALMGVTYGDSPLLGADDEAGICAIHSASSNDPVCADLVPIAGQGQCVGQNRACSIEPIDIPDDLDAGVKLDAGVDAATDKDAGPVEEPELEPTNNPIGIPAPFPQPVLEYEPGPRPVFEPVADSNIGDSNEGGSANNIQANNASSSSCAMGTSPSSQSTHWSWSCLLGLITCLGVARRRHSSTS